MLILTICGCGGLTFIELQFNEYHKKLIQAILNSVREENNNNSLIHQRLNWKQPTSQPETQVTSLYSWLHQKGAQDFR